MHFFFVLASKRFYPNLLIISYIVEMQVCDEIKLIYSCFFFVLWIQYTIYAVDRAIDIFYKMWSSRSWVPKAVKYK